MTSHPTDLTVQAAWVRLQVLEMIARARRGHVGGSLSCADIMVALYGGGVLRVRPSEPAWPDRDRFILSKGHAVEALYAVLAQHGFLSEAMLETYGADGTPLGGHPDSSLPGVDASTGSLGQGLGLGAGLAYAARRQSRDYGIFVLLGDGECYEGSVWEAAMFAAHHQLHRLVAIVDRNRQITLDDTETCLRLEPFADKWRSFGFETREIDGHCPQALVEALTWARGRESGAPAAIIARTTKGRGVSFMEAEIGWHHKVPQGPQLEQALQELRASLQRTRAHP